VAKAAQNFNRPHEVLLYLSPLGLAHIEKIQIGLEQQESEFVKQKLNRDEQMLAEFTKMTTLNISEFQFKNLLGVGTNGVVYRVAKNICGKEKQFALKFVFDFNPKGDTQIRNKYKHECDVLSKIPLHANVIHSLGNFVNRLTQEYISPLSTLNLDLYVELARNESRFIVFPYLPMTLEKYCEMETNKENGFLSVKTFIYSLLQICRGVCHIETHGLVHRDLKANNILVDDNCNIVICDFGESCFAPEQFKRNISDLNGSLWGNQAFKPPNIARLETSSGTVDYSKADLWAATAIMYDQVVRFPHNHDTREFNIDELKPFPDFYPSNVVELVKKVLSCGINERPSSVEVIEQLGSFKILNRKMILNKFG